MVALFRSAGTVHVYLERPVELGGGKERLAVSDAPVGQLEFNERCSMAPWEADLTASQCKGKLLVAQEHDALAGMGGSLDTATDSGRLQAITELAVRLQQFGAAGLVVVLSGPLKAAVAPHQRAQAAAVALPVGLVAAADGPAVLEAAQARGRAHMIRTPREVELGHVLQKWADEDAKRPLLAMLLRKLLRAVPDIDFVALCIAIMKPVDTMVCPRTPPHPSVPREPCGGLARGAETSIGPWT